MFPLQKKGRAPNVYVEPFPNGFTGIAYFTGLDIEIFDSETMTKINESGCYGMNPKPRHANSFNNEQGLKTVSDTEYNRRLEWKEKFGGATDEEEIVVGGTVAVNPFDIPQSLVLFLEEAFFLHHYIHCLDIRDLNDESIPTELLWSRFCELKKTFVESFVAFLYLKSKNWVVKSGIKFGGDFLLYKKGPQFFHASLIAIVSKSPNVTCIDYQRNERIAETTGKNVLYIEVFFPENLRPADYVENLDSFKVKEIFFQRNEIESKNKV